MGAGDCMGDLSVGDPGDGIGDTGEMGDQAKPGLAYPTLVRTTVISMATAMILRISAVWRTVFLRGYSAFSGQERARLA